MKLIIAGAPGSGKTWLAKYLEVELNLNHIEGDELFWENGEEVLPEKFRLSVRESLVKKNWIFEGHLGKVFDILSSHAPLIIEIRENTPKDFLRSLKKDLKTLIKGPHRRKGMERIKHHSKHWKTMKLKRSELINSYRMKFPERIFIWDGKESSLPALIEQLRLLQN